MQIDARYSGLLERNGDVAKAERMPRPSFVDDPALERLLFVPIQSQLEAQKPETRQELAKVGGEFAANQKSLAAIVGSLRRAPAIVFVLMGAMGFSIALGLVGARDVELLGVFAGAIVVLFSLIAALRPAICWLASFAIENRIRLSLRALESRSQLEAQWLCNQETIEACSLGVNDHQVLEWSKVETAFGLVRILRAEEVHFANRRPWLWLASTILAVVVVELAFRRLHGGSFWVFCASGTGVLAILWSVCLFAATGLMQWAHRAALLDLSDHVERVINEEYGTFAPQRGILLWIQTIIRKLEEWKSAAGKR